MSDNRTNEQIAAQSIEGFIGLGLIYLVAEKVLEALAAAGRLAGEPSEDQITKALNAFYDSADGQTVNHDRMRAALAAAAGTAPQTESALSQLNTILGVDIWGAKSFRADVRIDFDEFGNVLKAEVTAPTESSSTVDVEKLAEVIADHNEVYLPRTGDSGCKCGWRTSIGDYDHALHQARAVVEAIGGESL